MKWVGQGLRRFEDEPLLRGRGRFTGDLKAERTACFVRSPVASGRIERIDPPAGACVMTAVDLEGVSGIWAVLDRPEFVATEHPLLARDRVRFAGEPLAVVLAASQAEAEDIVEQTSIEISDADPVVEIDDALAESAPAVHENAPGNVLMQTQFESDAQAVDAAFASAHAVVEVNLRCGRQNAMPLEARAAHAAPDPMSGRITLTCGTQMPHLMRTAIADALGMPERDLHVIAPHVGGAFGQKMVLPPEYAVTVWLARHFGVSVRWTEDRRENLIASFHGRDQKLRVRGAFDDEGRLVALDGDVSANVGAYSSFPTTCGVEPLMAMAELPGCYRVPQYRARARAVTTNTCPMAPYRGVSRPAIVCGMERLMDRAARTLGLDRLELRRRNLVDSFPHTTPTGIELDAASYLETLDSAEREADPAEFQRSRSSARREGRRLGLGFSVFNERTGYGTPAFGPRRMGVTPGYETVDAAMDASGHVELRIGACPHGQGLATSLSQLVADELGVSPAQVRVVYGDTDRTPFGWGTFASRSMVISGGASLKAAGVLGQKIRSIAAAMLEASPDDLVLADGAVAVTGTDRSIGLREVARRAYHQAHMLPDGLEPGLTAQATYDPAGTFSNACHVAEVEVDVETGAVAVQRYIVVEDAGRLINPLIVDGQIMGGVTQGIANALFEEMLYDETGNAVTATLADYLVPTAAEIPRLNLHHMVTESEATATRAKGLGEGGAIGAPGAILNAVNDALADDGVQIDTLPATPRRIREALRAAGVS